MSSFLSRHPRIRDAADTLYAAATYPLDLKAEENFREAQRLIASRANNMIRVGFLCQYIPSWNRYRAIYDAMCANERFEPFIICVPSNIKNHELVDQTGTDNDTYDYYIEHGYEALNALTDDGWLPLKSLELDYVFYPRPYNSYMPLDYTSGVVSKYARICLFIYGMILSREDMRAVLEHGFLRNTFLYFADTEDERARVETMFKHGHDADLRKSLCVGTPAFQRMFAERGLPAPAWAFAEGRQTRFIWTPRWSTNPALGGSHFLDYKDVLIEYARTHRSVDLLFRPHPLTFGHMLETGEMTQENIDAFKRICADEPNLSLDAESEYFATFWESDALITDFSGIVPEYFITGKPIIYCVGNSSVHLLDYMEDLVSTCYVARDASELLSYMELLQHEDPLKEDREQMRERLFGSDFSALADNVLDVLQNAMPA